MTRITVGPVPSASAVEFVTQARKQLAEVHDASVLDATLTPDLLEVFEGYLDEWDREAHAGPDLVWHVEVDADYLEFAVHGLFQIVKYLEDVGDLTIAPDDPRLPFYRALVSGLLHALETEGSTNSEFAEQLRDFWPGLGSVS